MAGLVEKYLNGDLSQTIIDIGSYDVNGSYRPLFNSSNWKYIGVDLCAGPNVDVVLTSPYRFPFTSCFADIVISGQAFEHIEFFWLTWLEMVRVLKPEGLIFLIAPSRGPEHRYPVDCWRFYPDGFSALARYVSLELLEVHTDWDPHPEPASAPWGDTVGVFRKPRRGVIASIHYWLAHRIRHLFMPW
jgi:SAM-dependent methyltransferase